MSVPKPARSDDAAPSLTCTACGSPVRVEALKDDLPWVGCTRCSAEWDENGTTT